MTPVVWRGRPARGCWKRPLWERMGLTPISFTECAGGFLIDLIYFLDPVPARIQIKRLSRACLVYTLLLN